MHKKEEKTNVWIFQEKNKLNNTREDIWIDMKGKTYKRNLISSDISAKQRHKNL